MDPLIRFKRMPGAPPEHPLPVRASAGASGFDLPALFGDMIPPGAMMAVRTGWAIDIPHGYEGQIRPRSGLALRSRVTVLNAPGTIDSDYRGEIVVLLINHGLHPFAFGPGERIGQLIIAPVAMLGAMEVDELSDTARGVHGFGSTGNAAFVEA